MKTLALAVLASLPLAGCYVDEDHGRRHEARAEFVDPVCGVAVSSDSPWRTDYEGRTYYFHDRECRERFREHPQGYAGDRDRHEREAR